MSGAFELKGFLPVSFNEWENRISAVVFTPRCNWRCPYCHGWKLVTEPETLKTVTRDDVFEHLNRQTGWIDGVVVSGGEPTLQPGLADFIREVKALGFQVKLETNGTHPEVIEPLLAENLLDCLCMDYKGPLDERLERVTGVNEEASMLASVRRSYELAAASGIEREYHTTLCPSFITAEVLAEMGDMLEPGGTWFLQQYETEDCLNLAEAGETRFTLEELNGLEKIARARHGSVIVKRGKIME